jgi:hypothetical protein
MARGSIDCLSDPDVTAARTSIVLDRMGLDGYRAGSQLQASRWKGATLLSKAGLMVRAGPSPVTVRVPSSAAGPVAIRYGTEDPVRGQAVTFPAREGCSGWAVYPGGFLFKRKQCLRLQVQAGERRATVPLGLGVDCRASA